MVRGNFITLYIFLKASFDVCLSGVGIGNSFHLHQGRFRLDVRKNFFMEKVVRHCKWLPREVLESLEAFKTVNEALKDMVKWWTS